MSETFICSHCSKEEEKTQSEEAAIAEYENTFGMIFDPSNVSIMCDDCYEKFLNYLTKHKPLNLLP